MTNAVAIIPFGEMERLAVAVAKSKLFGIETPEQALTLMAIAHAEGRHPALAAQDYHIVKNRPVKKAEAMQRDFIAAGGRIEWHKLDDTIADATFSHPHGGSVRIVWDMERAKRAELGGNGMYKKFPRQMLRSRTVSEGVRTVFPAATSGMYVPEEVPEQQEPAFAGKTIVAEPHRTMAEEIGDSLPDHSAPPAGPEDKAAMGTDQLIFRILGAATLAEFETILDETAKQRGWLAVHRPELFEKIVQAVGVMDAKFKAVVEDAPAETPS